MTKESNIPLEVVENENSTFIAKPSDSFGDRESNELIVGFSGPVGSGLELVINQAEIVLENFGYTPVRIKLSNILRDLCSAKIIDVDISKLNKKNRYKIFQDAGDALREKFNNDILAELTSTKISLHRSLMSPEEVDLKDFTPSKTVYLIDQLKHPEEVKFFRMIYGNLFYLVGIFASDEQRKKFLVGESRMPEDEALRIMLRDKKEDISHGQQLEKTLKLSDLFIRNTNSHNDRVKRQLDRFFALIHGQNGLTPTKHEYGMYIAFAAGLRSACLSRQVGAAITDKLGDVISTGCNDVPKSGGGLYNESDGDKDHRCVKIQGGKCFNDEYKDKIKENIVDVLINNNIKREQAIFLASEIKQNTELKDLLEFSRSVHAEMDAITSVARKGDRPIQDGFLYTTTYPCHNCARHIIASGISKVFYIEPYEKSLARELHSDAIEMDPEEDAEEHSFVQFLHFEGISPRQYQNFFYPKNSRKNKLGKAIFPNLTETKKVLPKFLDDYRSLETKVVLYVRENLKISDEILSSDLPEL